MASLGTYWPRYRTEMSPALTSAKDSSRRGNSRANSRSYAMPARREVHVGSTKLPSCTTARTTPNSMPASRGLNLDSAVDRREIAPSDCALPRVSDEARARSRSSSHRGSRRSPWRGGWRRSSRAVLKSTPGIVIRSTSLAALRFSVSASVRFGFHSAGAILKSVFKSHS